jgi:hypothetical protein
LVEPAIRKVVLLEKRLPHSELTVCSDILAELDIPPSGIQEVEDVPYPKGTMDQGDFVHGETDRPAVMIYYSFQLHMRKLLNDIQKELYQESKSRFFWYTMESERKLTTLQRTPISSVRLGPQAYRTPSIV